MKVWIYIVVLLALTTSYFLLNSDKFYALMENFGISPPASEVTLVVNPDGRIEAVDPAGGAAASDVFEDRLLGALALTPNEALMIEKVVLETVRSSDSAVRTGNYKKLLLESLAGEGWDNEVIEQIRTYLDDPRAVFRSRVLKINSTHVETKVQYDHHLTAESVDMCMSFWKINGEKVTEAVSPYPVPQEVVVSILKVESNFGTHKGKEAVFNVFWSLSLADHPQVLKEALTEEGVARLEQKRRLQKRAKWGRSELRELVCLVMEGENEDLIWSASSWAGAFGLPQFIPTSYGAYARDGDNDGKIDLDNISDAVASIAYYLKSNGWKTNADHRRKTKVIMRYNNSSHYAGCILELADLIGKRIGDY